MSQHHRGSVIGIDWPFNYSNMMTVSKDVSPDDRCSSCASRGPITWDSVRRVMYTTLCTKESGLERVIFRQRYFEGRHIVS